MSVLQGPAGIVLDLANAEAKRFDGECIEPEHLLLGWLAAPQNPGTIALSNMGVDLASIRPAVEQLLRPGPNYAVRGNLRLTVRSKKTIEYAMDESLRLNGRENYYLGCEHILLGLVREDTGIAAKVLKELSVTLELLRAAVVSVLAAQAKPT
jgi:ATP-dependent Clp protease ATP-binding subunit ClpC